MSEDAVLLARRKSDNNNQDKWAWQQQKNKTFCSDWENFFCLDCFNEKHFHYAINDSKNNLRQSKIHIMYKTLPEKNGKESFLLFSFLLKYSETHRWVSSGRMC